VRKSLIFWCCAAACMGGCGGGGNSAGDPTSGMTAASSSGGAASAVPASVRDSVAGFVSYMQSFVATSDDTVGAMDVSAAAPAPTSETGPPVALH
jgi:hypothetical protein